MSIIKRRLTRKLIIAYLGGCVFLSMPAMIDLDKGCTESAFVDLDRSLLLVYKSQNQQEDALEDAERSGQQAQEDNQERDRDIDQLTASELKSMVEQRLALLLSAERRAVFAPHLPEHLYTILRRVKIQHAQLYGELAAPTYPEDPWGSHPNSPDYFHADEQRDKLEQQLMGIMLKELCIQLGQEEQDLTDTSRRQDDWVGCLKCCWPFLGAVTLTAVGVACYAPFAPCLPWHG